MSHVSFELISTWMIELIGCRAAELMTWQFTPLTPQPGRVIDAQTFEQLMAFDPLGVGLVLARNDQKEVRQLSEI